MNFLWYIAFFHDGSLNLIIHKNNELKIYMNSCELLPEENIEKIKLDKSNCVRGLLIIRNIKSILINEEPFYDHLEMIQEDSEVLDFELTGTGIELGISWIDFKQKKSPNYFTNILIESDEIFWEDEMNQIRINLSGLKSV